LIEATHTQSHICGTRSRHLRHSAAYGQMFMTTHWRSICAITLTLKQARRSTVPADAPYAKQSAIWFDADEIRCRKVFRAFMNLLNRAIYGNAVRRHNKRLRVIPILEKSLGGRWHFHAAMEPPAHLSIVDFEGLIRKCWSGTGWGYEQVLVRAEADAGWIGYLLKPSQKAGFEHSWDCIDWESFHNPVADA
jgi:hypothetical protein